MFVTFVDIVLKKNLISIDINVYTPGEKPYKCDKCQYSTARKDHLQKHIGRVHSSDMQYKCNKCEYRFDSEKKLNNHIRLMHTTNDDNNDGKRKHQCNICSKTFVCKSKLERHKLIHTDEKQFCCQYCHRRFRRKDHLQNHMKSSIHNDRFN
mgnify:CR=1 FL=1